MSLESQLAALIDAIGADIKNKVETTDSRLSNSREWNAATVPRAEAEAGTAATRRAWTAARVRQSMRAGILGEVSQESGVPTGAIIERGSNANGEYVRFADGTQICTSNELALLSGYEVVGNLYASEPFEWTFPSAFVARPALSLSAAVKHVWLMTSSIWNVSTYARVRLVSTDTEPYGNLYSVTAIGRWY